MNRNNTFKLIILACYVICQGLNCFPAWAFGTQADNDVFLQELSAEGERGLRSYALKVKGSQTNDDILHYAAEGVRQRNVNLLTVARVLAEISGDSQLLADVYVQMALFGRSSGNFSGFHSSLVKARSLYSDAQNMDAIANTLHLQRDFLIQSGDIARALDLYQKAVETKLFDNNYIRYADLFRGLGESLVAADQHVPALDQFRRSAEFYERARNHNGAARAYFIFGENLLMQGQATQALEAYEKALENYLQTGDSLSQGNALLRIGEICVRLGDYGRADAVYRRAQDSYEKSGSSESLVTLHANMANLAALRGETAIRTGNYDEALKLLESGLEHAVINSTDSAILNRQKAIVYMKRKDTARAAASISSALSAYEKIGDISSMATMYVMLGDLYSQNQSYPSALDAFFRAESLYRQLGDQKWTGYVLRRSGDVLYFSAEKSLAIEKYTAALEVYKRTSDLKEQALMYRLLAEIYMQQGANTIALKNYGMSLSLFEQSGDIAGMKLVYRGQAEALMRIGDNAKALEMQTKAASLGESSESIHERAKKKRIQADIYYRAGDNAMATLWYEEALELYRKSGDTSGEGNVVRSLGDIFVSSGNFQRAQQHYDRALPLLESTNDLAGQGNVFQMQGYIAYSQGYYDQALQLYDRAQALFEVSHNRLGVVNATKGKAEVFAARRDVKNGKPLFHSVLDYYVRIGDLEAQAYTLFSLAQIAVLEGANETALQYYQETLELLEKIRKQSGFSRLKKKFMDKVYDLYEEAVVFMLRNNFSAEAMRNAEAMKARVFIDQLAEGHIDIKTGESKEVKEKRESLTTKIAALDQKISALVLSGDNSTTLESLRKEVVEAEKGIDALDINLRTGNALYASVHYPEPISVQELQKKILKSDEALLEFFVTSSGVYCFIVTDKEFKSFNLPLTRKELEQLSKNLLAAIDKGPSRDTSQFDESSATLYDRLLLPVEKMVGHNKVIIIPDGILTRIPFEVLVRKEKGHRQFFLERNTIKYFQSATLLALQRTRFRKEKFSSSFIGFGDPVYDYTAPSGKRSEVTTGVSESAAGKRLVRLEASGKEVQSISELFEAEGFSAKVLLGDKATRMQALSDEMKQYGFIHFAAHGIKSGGYQAIALSRTPRASNNGMLSIGDIMSSSYEKSRLVVLSACQSGLGTFDRGEGVTGLTRAVMYAGSPAAVVSLWNVEDRGAMVLMENFYENVILRKMELDQALHSAKLTMIKSDKYSHPIFWGSFVMYGE